MSEPLGKSAHMTCFVDANHDSNVFTQCLHITILIYVMDVPIIWCSNNQNTVESSMFGSEFVTMRILRYLILALRYKLRMFGVPLDIPSNMKCDNQGVVNNISLPQFNLVHKHNTVNYHYVREAATEGILCKRK